MLDGSLTFSSVYTSVHMCELSFLLCYKKFVSSLPSVVPLEMEVEEVLVLHKDEGTKYCCGVLTFANNCVSS